MNEKFMFAVFACAVLLAVPASANLLTNGDFEQPFSVGWHQDTIDDGGVVTFERTDTLGQPTPGYAARIYKYWSLYASLNQTVDVPSADLELSLDGRLTIGGISATCWPVAAFVVSYLNDAGRELGSTMLIARDQYCEWNESDTLNFIDVTSPGDWVDYDLDIAQEIADNLPGVNADDVRKVRVELYTYVNGT